MKRKKKEKQKETKKKQKETKETRKKEKEKKEKKIRAPSWEMLASFRAFISGMSPLTFSCSIFK